VKIPFISSESWTILSPIEQSIKKKIEAVGTPLKDWDISINYGIKTGCNEAFIINGEMRAELIQQDPHSAEIIRPILRGRDIKKYGYEFADLYLLYIPWHFPLHNDESIKGASSIAEDCFLTQYPTIYKHLFKYKDMLSARNKDETGIRYEWYALQRWGANYWEDFYKQKIMYNEIGYEPKYFLDKEGYFFPDKTTFIMTGKYILYLYALLNSKLLSYIFKTYYAGSLGEKGHQYSKIYIEKLPIILPSPENICIFNDLLSQNNYIAIENLVIGLYHLTDEETIFIFSLLN